MPRAVPGEHPDLMGGSTLERPLVARPQIDVPSVRLEVVAGPDAGRSTEVDLFGAGRLYIGTSEACHIRLTDPLVSRRHLALEVGGPHVRLIDLGSTNGTLVNNVRVVEVLLRGGESIVVGETGLALRFGEPAKHLLRARTRFGKLLGQSPEMGRLYPICERLALSDVPILIEGETGTGKELLAEAIHEASARSNEPFVVFDCTTSPPGLMESRLFGHERGAFTGATGARAGVFEEASGGTLLIDEIGDLDLELQARLLRAVQSGQVQRLGSTKWVRTNVRIIAASRRDLESEIQAGRFRDDLYYRLAVSRVELPALRRRSGDVAFLAKHFWQTLSQDGSDISPELVEQLERSAWPGNVRELYNVVANRVALADLADSDLAGSLAPEAGAKPPVPAHDFIAEVVAAGDSYPRARQRVLEAFESLYLDSMLEKHQNNISKAAAASGIARRYFYTIRARRGR